MTNQTAPTVIRNAAVHYAPYACQYAKHGDLQTDIASAVTCHHCKARFAYDKMAREWYENNGSDNPVWRSILAGGGDGGFAQAQPDRASVAQWIDDAVQPKQAKPAPIRFVSITPRYPGEDTRRMPAECDKHECANDVKASCVYREYAMDGDWFLCIGRKTDVIQVIYCPYCGSLLPTPQLHEGNAQAPIAQQWVKASEGLPEDCELVAVKIHSGAIGIGECHRRDRNNWKITMPGVGTFWGRSTVTEWRRI